MHIRIVLPAYNEEDSLPPLLEKINEAYNLYKWDASVFVVNDGSKDNTLEVARNFKADIPIHVIDVQPNSGLAKAINTGLRTAIVSPDKDFQQARMRRNALSPWLHAPCD